MTVSPRRSALVVMLSLLVFTWNLTAQQIPAGLRPGVAADDQTIQVALEMLHEGWTYVMPQPKSKQAAWGNYDGRTTWYVGYWTNRTTGDTSSVTPILRNGKYVGDGRGTPGWRRGGSPPPPTILEWLLSASGGIPPR